MVHEPVARAAGLAAILEVVWHAQKHSTGV